MQAQLSPARIDSIHTNESQRKPVTHCQAVSKTAGSDGSCVQRDTFWLLYMRPLQWWPKTKGFSLRRNPLYMIKVTRRCFHALDMWRKPLFLSQGPVLGAPCHRVMITTDASLTGWGAVMSGHPARGLWSGHHFMWHIYCLEMLVVFLALKHFLLDLGGHRVLGALTTQRWFLTSTTREVCIHAPFTGWCTKSLCGSSFRSLQALLGLLSLRRVFKASARQSSARTVSVSGGLYVSLLTGCLECGV